MFKRVNSLLFCTAILGVLLPTMVQAQQPVTNGFRDFSFLTSGGPNNPTGDKPESKLWFNDGIWWGCLFNNSLQEHHIYRFKASTQSWTDTGTAIDPRNLSRADVLWDGQHLYVASHIYNANGVADSNSANWGRLYRYSYSAQNKSYTQDANFPVNITKGRSETLVLAKDSTGQLWVTWVQSGKVMVNRSTTSDLTWGVPFVLPVNQTSASVLSDDISSIIAFQGNKVGVMWSNQATQIDYFAVHLDASGDTVWQAEEIALPAPGQTGPYADDHINLKADSSGRVFAAVKTSFTSSTSPLIKLLVRSTTGTWSNHTVARVSNGHTRPIVLLDPGHSRLYIVATAPGVGGSIYYKSSDINNIQFTTGLGIPFIKSATDTAINNPTSTKQNVSSTTGLLVLASDPNTDHYLHNYLNLAN